MVASLRQTGGQTGSSTGGGEEESGRLAGDRLETTRLMLRAFAPADVDDLYRITRDPEVMRHIGDGHPLTHAETARNLTAIISAFHRRGFGRWALVLKESGALAGYCGLSMGN